MSEPLNWDDVRIFLAVLRASSARGAAQALGVSRPTVSRRLDALEERLGLDLFERRSDGLHATAAAAELVPVAEEAERAMLAVARVAHAADHTMRGPIRVTMPGVAAADLLMPDLVAFADEWPEIDLEIQSSLALTNLAERKADVAIRFMPTGTSPKGELAGRRVGNAYMAIYGEGEHWIGMQGGGRDRAWVAQTPHPDLPIRCVIPDGEALRAACRHGMGLARLPCFMVGPQLRRRSKPEPGFDIWVVVHPDLRKNPRLRAFRDAMVAALKKKKAVLEGRRRNPLTHPPSTPQGSATSSSPGGRPARRSP